MGRELDKAIADLHKRFGSGIIGKLGDRQADLSIQAIPTGSMSLDLAIGIGGVPRGRITEIFGPEGCLDSNTRIRYEIRSHDGRRQNGKGGTIERLWQRFNNISTSGRGLYPRPQTQNAEFFVPSVNAEGRIFANRVVGVFETGTRPCYEITTRDGAVIIATEEHKFCTESGFVSLGELGTGSTIFIHNNTPYTVESCSRPYRPELCVKHHPVAGRKTIADRYRYHRLSRSRAAVEAHLNGLRLEEYISLLNKGELEGLQFLPTSVHVHHKDENVLNDALDNLAVLPAAEHDRLHATRCHNNLRFMVIPDQIASIRYVGTRRMYDLHVESPFNNYVANQFVVHNSGKTTVCQHIIAEAQALGGIAAMVDIEHALEPDYAAVCGVNVQDLYISQPDSGEEALEVVEGIIRSGDIDVVVIDSVAALVPRAEIEGNMGDSLPGLQARLMSQALRKLSGVIAQSKAAIVFTNQIRHKIGVMFGSPETTPGGMAMRFYASVRLDIRRRQPIKDGDRVIGNKVRVRVVKNKVAPPYREAEFEIIYAEGISYEGDLIELGLNCGVLERRGAYIAYNGETIGQGREKTKDALREDPDLAKEIAGAIRANAFEPSSSDDEE
jgi:recombination protein RecA